ncbi:MAG TPA: hypothetical protein VKR06_18840 [Ktedonosporobacter sp.]|nr:hypothetical protein [Ktedonosporobacter sp.]
MEEQFKAWIDEQLKKEGLTAKQLIHRIISQEIAPQCQAEIMEKQALLRMIHDPMQSKLRKALDQ